MGGWCGRWIGVWCRRTTCGSCGKVERAWRRMKSELAIRSMHHRKAERIQAHVPLCWLALLLVRVCEVRCGRTWRQIHQEMDRLQRGEFEGPAASRSAPS